MGKRRGNANRTESQRNLDTSTGSGTSLSSQERDSNRRLLLALQEVGGEYDTMDNNVEQPDEVGGCATAPRPRLLTMGVGMCCVLLAFVVVVAMSLGTFISVHYFDTTNPRAGKLSAKDALMMYSGLSAYQKVTALDPAIATSNVIKRTDSSELDLGKVITTSSSGQLKVLMVVQEEPPLNTMADQSADMITSNNAHATKQKSDFRDDFDLGTPLSIEEAEQLVPGYTYWKETQPKLDVREPTILPSLCSDGYTYGFQDWDTLRRAIQEANSISAERFMKWSEYFATHQYLALEDDSLYYEQDVVFTICPGAVLKGRRRLPIPINAENVVLECDDGCVLDSSGTHLAFGANAKNVLVRGLTFKSATTSSMTFFHDGAEATFEDCSWINNVGQSQQFGSVADINSTSIVNFFRCDIGFEKQLYPFGGSGSKSTSSLSIRQN